MTSRFQLMWEFEAWANRRTLESIRPLQAPGECLRLFGHILAAQKVWLTRLAGGDSSHVELFGAKTIDECEAELAAIDRQGSAYLETLTDEVLGRELVYTNQTGKAFHNTPLDILTHLGMHSQYHRGQIAALVRRAGAVPAVTDFIAFRRQGQ
jgi:uncharacterized damage-inducible protein DinB